jgi:hypothetical protein
MGLLVTSKEFKRFYMPAFTVIIGFRFLVLFSGLKNSKMLTPFGKKQVSEKSLRIFWQ